MEEVGGASKAEEEDGGGGGADGDIGNEGWMMLIGDGWRENE
jgi:hypothetical protein